MTKVTLTVAACSTLLWAGTALGVPVSWMNCYYARITAWKVYQSCVGNALAKMAGGIVFDEHGKAARCRHAYFKKWTAFQRNPSLADSTCIGSRFTDNGDGTVTDNLSGLVWEKKDDLGGIHDKDNIYTESTGSPWAENGTAFTDFLRSVNGGGGFAGANGWRLPTLAELQTIVLDFPCTGRSGGPRCSCPSSPCVNPTLDSSNTQSGDYWSATSHVPSSPTGAWGVSFDNGHVTPSLTTLGLYIRAVRGGL